MLYLVLCKMNFPTRLWYNSLSTAKSFSTSLSLWLGCIGVLAILHANLFPWEGLLYISIEKKKIPFLECATSICRKYFNLSNSLTSNSLVKHCLEVYSFLSFPVMIILSTYTKRAITPFVYIYHIFHYFGRPSKPCL